MTDDHLFDPTASHDPEVERLERLLRPLGRRDDAPIAAPRRTRNRWIVVGLAAAAALVAAVTVPRDAPVPSPAAGRGAEVRDERTDATVAVGAWIDAGEADREILVGDVGRVTLAARSRLQVRYVSAETTRLYLERGRLEARVAADARPRFFQVDTDAARCVDLGCRYTLEADGEGVATVRVVTGQVAFEAGPREVFVPAGASCVARTGSGPGTPRFDDARDGLCAALDAFDAAIGASAESRRSLARAALDAVDDGRDTLAAWHLLQDPDAEIAAAAASRLVAVAGAVVTVPGAAAQEVRAAWKERLEPLWW